MMTLLGWFGYILENLKHRGAASQVVGSPHRFLSINPAYSSSSALLMLSYGYAVLMGATMPILGEGSEEPNDTVKQLVSAQAAADKMVKKHYHPRSNWYRRSFLWSVYDCKSACTL